MAYATPTNRTATIIAKELIKRIKSDETEAKDVALCARVWIEIEAFKREMRGLPRLLGASMKELHDALSALRAPRQVHDAFVEIPETKESIIPQTVTTPPPPDAPK